MIVYGAIMVILFVWCFAATRERLVPPAEQKTKLSEDFKRLISNPYWLMMFGAALIDMTMIIVRDGSMFFYTEYYLGYSEAKGGALIAVGTFGFMAGASATRFMVAAIGKKWGFVLSHVLLAISCIGTLLTGPDKTVLNYSMLLFNAFSGGLNAVLFFSMIADTADYSAWKFKARTTGIIFSATTCAQKVGMGVGGWLSTLVLTVSGYLSKPDLAAAGAQVNLALAVNRMGQIPGFDFVPQSVVAVNGILGLVSWIPALGYTLVAVGFLFYGLDEKFLKQIHGDLAKESSEGATPA
jgi:GPH family glycoside/pentoside/hexuronide:cation symporter